MKMKKKEHPISQLRQLLHLLLLVQRKRSSSRDMSYALLAALKSRRHSNHNPSSSSTQGLIQIHPLVITLGFQSLVFLQTALITMYSDSGNTTDAHKVFDEMPRPTLVSWTALISAYVNNHRPNTALSLFRQMQLRGKVHPDPVTLTVALSACADLGALNAGEWIHTYIRKKQHGFGHNEEDVILTNALINMYCKCGHISAAHHLFETVPSRSRDVATWTSIITGYALHGRHQEALQLFNRMTTTVHGSSNCRPNSVTFVGVLTACSHAGLVEQGKHHWEQMMRCYNVKPTMALYGCMVDLFCRARRSEEAYEFIQKMPVQANAIIWRTLLSACSLKEGNDRIMDTAIKRLLELEPDCVGDGVIMSNVYAGAGMWEEKERMRTRKGRRAPGCSLIEVGNQVHEFVAGDRRQVKKMEFRQVLEGMLLHCSKDMEYG